eukprot:1806070-Amphidinium_carterae.1
MDQSRSKRPVRHNCDDQRAWDNSHHSDLYVLDSTTIVIEIAHPHANDALSFLTLAGVQSCCRACTRLEHLHT